MAYGRRGVAIEQINDIPACEELNWRAMSRRFVGGGADEVKAVDEIEFSGFIRSSDLPELG